jgi:hypothetical protein
MSFVRPAVARPHLWLSHGYWLCNDRSMYFGIGATPRAAYLNWLNVRYPWDASGQNTLE